MCFFSFSCFVGERLSGASICSVPFAAVTPHSACGFVEEPKAGLLLTGPQEDFLGNGPQAGQPWSFSCYHNLFLTTLL